MQTNLSGALPSQRLQKLIEAGFIIGASQENISPASLDLTISDEIYKIDGLLLPRKGESIQDLLPVMGASQSDLSEPLQCGQMYIVRLNESLALPKEVYGFCNPKSSTGRLDMHVRVLADGVPRYDSAKPRGYVGELWAAIKVKSFAVRLHENTPLTQLRLFTANTQFSDLDLEVAVKQHDLVWHETEDRPLEHDELVTHDKDGALILTALVTDDVCGYVCTADPTDVLDIAKVSGHEASRFFSPVYAEKGVLKLVHDKFYILSGAERVRIPPHMACEMAPMDERSGDFRSHYAGFLDPGWGWGSDGKGKGRPFTLEVRPFEDVVVRKQQPIAKIRFENLTEPPIEHYDANAAGHNYLSQSGPQLGKHFY